MTNQIALGYVSFGNKTYLATATITDTNGKEVPITDEMRKSNQVYQTLIQQILDQHQTYYKDQMGEISSLNFEGLTFTKGGFAQASHVAAKTDAIWTRFITLLQNPSWAERHQAKVDLTDMTEFKSYSQEKFLQFLRIVLRKRYQQLYGKNPIIKYEPLEEKFLKAFDAQSADLNEAQKLLLLQQYYLAQIPEEQQSDPRYRVLD